MTGDVQFEGFDHIPAVMDFILPFILSECARPPSLSLPVKSNLRRTGFRSPALDTDGQFMCCQ